MTNETTTIIKPSDVCNLGRLPMSSSHLNPLRQTVSQILIDESIGYRDTAIFDYYKKGRFIPETLADFYQIESAQLDKYKSNSIFLPWVHTHPNEMFVNEDFYGVRDDGKIIEVVTKLKKIVLSVQINGYVPNRFIDRKAGFMTGYWLVDKNIKRFYIISGNHRSSVLGAMDPTKNVIVKYEKCGYCKRQDIKNNEVFNKKCMSFFIKKRNNIYIDIVDKCTAAQWPSVKSGFLNKKVAMEIFDRYTSEK